MQTTANKGRLNLNAEGSGLSLEPSASASPKVCEGEGKVGVETKLLSHTCGRMNSDPERCLHSDL